MFPSVSPKLLAVCTSEKTFWKAFEEHLIPEDKKETKDCEINTFHEKGNADVVTLEKKDEHIRFAYSNYTYVTRSIFNMTPTDFTDKVKKIAEVYRENLYQAIQEKQSICSMRLISKGAEYHLISESEKITKKSALKEYNQWKLIEPLFANFLSSIGVNSAIEINAADTRDSTITLSLQKVLQSLPVSIAPPTAALPSDQELIMALPTATLPIDRLLIQDIEEQQFTDLIINCNPKDTPATKERVCGAHEFILRSRSLVFQNMFNIKMQEHRKREIVFPYPKASVAAFILYLYDLDNPFKKPNAAYLDVRALLALSDSYGIDSLKAHCLQVVAENTPLAPPNTTTDIDEDCSASLLSDLGRQFKKGARPKSMSLPSPKKQSEDLSEVISVSQPVGKQPPSQLQQLELTPFPTRIPYDLDDIPTIQTIAGFNSTLKPASLTKPINPLSATSPTKLKSEDSRLSATSPTKPKSEDNLLLSNLEAPTKPKPKNTGMAYSKIFDYVASPRPRTPREGAVRFTSSAIFSWNIGAEYRLGIRYAGRGGIWSEAYGKVFEYNTAKGGWDVQLPVNTDFKFIRVKTFESDKGKESDLQWEDCHNRKIEADGNKTIDLSALKLPEPKW